MPRELVEFHPSFAPQIAQWAVSQEDLDHWASLRQAATPANFTAWHADPDVRPRVLLEGGPLAYGELWISKEEDEVELGRLLVAPQHRGRGLGRALVRALLQEARTLAVATAWVRIVPENQAALACYLGAGFVRAAPEIEDQFNAPQPRAYTWLHHSLSRGADAGS